jgi:hypothetical protein
MFGWIFAAVYFVVLLAVQNWWDQHVPRIWRYDPVRKWRSSRMWLFFKLWIIIAIPVYPVMCWMLGASIWNWLTGTFFGTLALVIFGSIGTRVICVAMYPHIYAQLRQDGWDPLWDSWWSGIVNRDPEEVKAGKPPLCIIVTNFTPPPSWTERCPCGAAQPEPVFWCWNCRQGFEHGCQKMACPNCDMTFKEASPGAGRTQAITCPGCGTATFMPTCQ